MFRLILWIIIMVCLYTILTTRSVEVISIAGFFGFISTWVLIRWNKILNQIDKMG
jgi:hypothetical protein